MTEESAADPATYAAVASRVPFARMGRAAEVAPAAVFLASDESAYVTGQVLGVDGGALVLGWTPSEPSL